MRQVRIALSVFQSVSRHSLVLLQNGLSCQPFRNFRTIGTNGSNESRSGTRLPYGDPEEGIRNRAVHLHRSFDWKELIAVPMWRSAYGQ